MTSPQLEHGYVKIANEIMDALIKYRIPGEQMQCLLFIIRKTYGFNKKWDTISNSQFVEFTGLKKSSVCRAINVLVDKNIVYKKANNYIPSYYFNKRYGSWKVLAKKLTYEIPGRVSINDIKKKIRKRDNNSCRLCEYDGDLTLDKLPVHHIDFDQTNNSDKNLITLCKSCHAKSHTPEKQKEILAVSKKVNEGVTKKRPTKDTLTKDNISEDFKFKIKVKIPTNIFLTSRMKNYAIKQGCKNDKYIQDLFEGFVNFYKRDGRKWQDWTLTFYDWVRNDKKKYNPDKYKKILTGDEALYHEG